MKKSLGFTLAEVLITLGIIGVVAAMTIPTLMNQTGQAEFRSGFKKIISTLSQAVTMSVALDSTDFSNLTAGTTGASGSIANMFTQRMNVVKVATDGGGLNSTGTTPTIAATGNYTLFFNDGMVVSFADTEATCTIANPCSAVIDTNGVKRPNRLTNCEAAPATATAETTPATDCTAANVVVGDRFSVRFVNQQVMPNGRAARYVMYN